MSGKRTRAGENISNPWLREPEKTDHAGALLVVAQPETPVLRPQPGAIAAPAARRGLSRRVVDPQTTGLTVVGAHGGAGESVLSAWLGDVARTGGHGWPVHEVPGLAPERVLLVCRSHAPGLRAAQAAAIEWASGVIDVELLGLVAIADVPGKRPKPLVHLFDLVSAAVPRVFEVPWVEALRLGEDPQTVLQQDRNLQRTITALTAATTPTRNEGA